MKVGKRTKNFIKKEHFETLNLKLSLQEYRQFIRKIHVRICEEQILSTREGFIIPNKMGDISVVKQKKTEGIYTTHSAIAKKKKEYNYHTFGFIYSIKWDRKIRGRLYHTNYSNLVPKYKGNPIMWFPVFQFTPTREHLKRALAKKIFNQDFMF